MTRELTHERLQEIKARCERATPGPWKWDDTPWGEGKRLFAVGRKDQWGDVLTLLDDGSAAGEYSPTDATEADRDFIAHAREDVPALVAEVERLWKLIDDLREQMKLWRIRAAGLPRDAASGLLAAEHDLACILSELGVRLNAE